jgi:hypothetical protein
MRANYKRRAFVVRDGAGRSLAMPINADDAGSMCAEKSPVCMP